MTHCHQTTGSLGPQSTSIKGCWEKLVSTPPACEIMSGFQIQICLVFKKGHMITLSQFQFQKCKGEPRSLCCVLFTSAMTAVMRRGRCALLEITSIALKCFCCLFAYMTLFSPLSPAWWWLLLSYHYCHHRHHQINHSHYRDYNHPHHHRSWPLGNHHHHPHHHSSWPLGTQGAPLKWEAGWPGRGAGTPPSWINIKINIMMIYMPW